MALAVDLGTAFSSYRETIPNTKLILQVEKNV
jgi:hypothetical protein